MPKIEFFISPETSVERTHLFVCTLIEHAYEEKNTILLRTENAEQANYYDQLLWVFRDDSFVPHALYKNASETDIPVLITGDLLPNSLPHTLINLHSEVLSSFESFAVIYEIVFKDPTLQQSARNRYRHYKQLGYEITTHQPNTIKMMPS